MAIMEQILQQIYKELLDVDIEVSIQRMTYKEAMDRFGSDKPDTRFGLEFVNISDIVKECGFGVFANAASDEKGSVRGINVKGGAEAFSKKGMKKLEEHAKLYKAKGLAWIKLSSPVNPSTSSSNGDVNGWCIAIILPVSSSFSNNGNLVTHNRLYLFLSIK